MVPIVLLCGQAGSGKDTAGKYLADNYNGVTIGQADPLKWMARDVFGFTEEQLFGPSNCRDAVDLRATDPSYWESVLSRMDSIKEHISEWFPGGNVTCDDILPFIYSLKGRCVPLDRSTEIPVGAVQITIEGQTVLVDDEDVDVALNPAWRIDKEDRKHTAYVKGYVDGKTHSLHRAIMGELKPNELVDHLNGDGLDNRRANLRVASRSQNAANTKRGRIKGVSWDKNRGKWSAKICFHGKTLNLGRFADKDEALSVFRQAAEEFYWDFASHCGLTPRNVLQFIGTEFGRFHDPNLWSNIAQRTAARLLSGGWSYSRTEGLARSTLNGYDFVFITDGRFKSEILNTTMANGVAVKISRGNGNGIAHKSESELLTIPNHFFSAIIDNDGSKSDLFGYLAQFMDEFYDASVNCGGCSSNCGACPKES